ncbi:tripartite tricarboxylate transporter TctB family protein [Phytoactinopolyspora mesophila]|uniref:MFS transporter n=1 Tax=Phytoactinopolyspora mesophila TaxID=2650750 RepID=A0A7K3MAB7_9ACTN|nr:tripartite tricarboxylate transporter TctB family protein [Phytoactinopolyspora mesophila]NDL60234.1 hypothetical protein [Phytoactinopolyspora mesophila]
MLVLVGLLLMGLLAMPASAAEEPMISEAGTDRPDHELWSPDERVQSMCSGDGDHEAIESDLLPINRWAGSAGSIHTRLDAFAIGDLDKKAQRNFFVSTTMSFGHSMWQAGVNMVHFATTFCVGDGIARGMDSLAATVGDAIVKSGILATLVIVTLLFTLFRAGRHSARPLGTVLRMIFVLVLFTALLNGARSSTDDEYGTLSPGSLMSRTVTSIQSLASAPAAALTNAGLELAGMSDSEHENLLHCGRYVASMRDRYERQHRFTEMAATTMALDAMWQTSGLRAYADAQFGNANPYGAAVFCRLLDYQGGVSPFGSAISWGDNAGGSNVSPTYFSGVRGGGSSTQIAQTLGQSVPGEYGEHQWLSIDGKAPDYGAEHGPNDLAANPYSLAWLAWEVPHVDRNMIAWAACEYVGKDGTNAEDRGWRIANGWNRIDNNQSHGFLGIGGSRGSISAGYDSSSPDNDSNGSLCDKWWERENADDFYEWGGTSPFDFKDDEFSARAITFHEPGVQDFLLNLHGDVSGQAMATSAIFMASAFIVLLVFAMLAFAVIASKIMLVVMILMVFLVLLADLLPTQQDSSKIGNLVKKFLSLAIFAFGVTLLLSIMVVTTGILVQLGGNFGTGSVVHILWTGTAPVAAIVILHYLFKSVFKIPSPFTPTGALAYSTMAMGGAFAGAAGGSAAGTLISRRGRQAGRAATDRTRSEIGRYLSGANVTGSDRKRRGRGSMSESLASDTNRGTAPESSEPKLTTLTPEQQEKAKTSRLAEQRLALKDQRQQARTGKRIQKDILTQRYGHKFGPRRMGHAAGERVAAATRRFAASPVRATLKYGGLAGAGLLAGFGSLPVVAGGAAALWGVRRLRRRHDLRDERNRHRIGLWREQQDRIRERQRAEDNNATKSNTQRHVRETSRVHRSRRHPDPGPLHGPQGPPDQDDSPDGSASATENQPVTGRERDKRRRHDPDRRRPDDRRRADDDTGPDPGETNRGE